jgi:hypothetical protein
MAQSALNSHRPQGSLIIEKPSYANDSVQLQQGKRGRRIIEVDLAALNSSDEIRRKRVYVNL